MIVRLSEDQPNIDMKFGGRIIRDVCSVISGTKEEFEQNFTHRQSKRNYIYVVTDYYTDSNGVNHPAIKIGDGNSYVGDLPYITADNAGTTETLMQHINDNIRHITQAERVRWNDSVVRSDVEDGKLIFYKQKEV